MSDPIGWPLALLGFVIVALGSVVQGTLGFGLGLLAAPLLAAVEPRFVPAPMLLAALVLTALMARREPRSMDMAGVGWALAGRLAGTALAGLVLVLLPGERFQDLFGAMILLAVALSLVGSRVDPAPGPLVLAGLLSGLMGTITSVGGPPMALLYQRAPGDRIRATLSGFFAVGATFSLVALAALGRFSAAEARIALPLVAGVLAGFALSGRVADRLDPRWIRPAVLGLSTAAGLVVLLR